MKVFFLIVLTGLSGCSWFHSSKPPAPEPPELIVTGTPAGSVILIDDVQSGQAADGKTRSRIIEVAPGAHTVEVRMGDTIAYRENTYVGPGEKTVITVMSGNSRN